MSIRREENTYTRPPLNISPPTSDRDTAPQTLTDTAARRTETKKDAATGRHLFSHTALTVNGK